MNDKVKELLGLVNVQRSEDINFAPLLGKVCYGVKRNGKTFLSRLVEIDEEHKLLWFELKNGMLISNSVTEILLLREVAE